MFKGWDEQGNAFTGHKSLLGPTGIGGVLLSQELNPESTKFGGTGVDSRSLYHPQEYPHQLEAGTLNLFGVLALDGCLDYVECSQSASYLREMRLLGRLKDGLEKVSRVRLYGVEQLLKTLTRQRTSDLALDFSQTKQMLHYRFKFSDCGVSQSYLHGRFVLR